MKNTKHQMTVIFCTILLSATTGCATCSVDNHARNMAASCAACHGTNGNSVGGIPALAGADKSYFITQMKNFKSGARPATVMNNHAKGYSDEEIAQLANFFAAQKP